MTNSNGSAVAVTPKRAALASYLGAVVDWYDFFLYGTASALVFAKVFFPEYNPVVGTIAAFATLAIGFFFRPLGSIIFGHFGDRIGRRTMLVATMVLMGGASVAVGLLPTYHSIGIAAPILLVLLRILQGVAVGGEWGGASLMAIEHAPSNRRALYGSVVQTGVFTGSLLSTSAFALVTALTSEEAFLAWGWRIPFLASALVVFAGFLVRRTVPESPEFVKTKADGAIPRMPLWEAIKSSPSAFFIIILMRLGEAVGYYMVVSFSVAYATNNYDVDSSVMLNGLIISSATSLVVLPLFSLLADRHGYARVFIFGAVAGSVIAFPFFAALRSAESGLIILGMVAFMNLCQNPLTAAQQPMLNDLFKREVRYSGAGFAYQLSSALGGFTPLIASALVAWNDGGSNLTAAYMMMACVISGLTAFAIRKRIATNYVRSTAPDAESAGVGTSVPAP